LQQPLPVRHLVAQQRLRDALEGMQRILIDTDAAKPLETADHGLTISNY
jgi:hypothetical protein